MNYCTRILVNFDADINCSVSPTWISDTWSVAARFSFVVEYRKTMKTTVTLEKIPGQYKYTFIIVFLPWPSEEHTS